MMKTKQKIIPILLMTIYLASPALAETIQCRAESASIIAGLKSESSERIEPKALALARRAALMMCERKLDYKTTVGEKNKGNPETEVNKLTVEVEPQEEEKRRSFLGLSFEKSERNKGHHRLQKRN